MTQRTWNYLIFIIQLNTISEDVHVKLKGEKSFSDVYVSIPITFPEQLIGSENPIIINDKETLHMIYK